jgi:hypothetical protein
VRCRDLAQRREILPDARRGLCVHAEQDARIRLLPRIARLVESMGPPHAHSTRIGFAPVRSAISQRRRSQPLMQTISSPGSTRLTMAASMPALPVRISEW